MPSSLGTEVGSSYGGINQRWLIIHSEKAHLREKKTLDKRIHKAEQKALKKLKKLKSMEFSCEKDARKAAERLNKKLLYHLLHNITLETRHHTGKRGRPAKNAPIKKVYKLNAELMLDEQEFADRQLLIGKFIIATNELDENILSSEDLLSHYKDQQSVERGFRFLKDPFFLCSSVFLKKETRIVSLGMVMCLCLLIYTLTQRLIRQRLKQQNRKLPNQLGKPIQRPTLRWIFQVFEGVHVIYHRTAQKSIEIVANMRKFHREVIHLLGRTFEEIYRSG